MHVRKTRHDHLRTQLPLPDRIARFLSPARKHLIRFALLVGVLAALAPMPSQAATAGKRATVPCWKRLLNDWYDGTINNIYPIPCYQQAIKHLPASADIYGSAKDDIKAAELAALNHKLPPSNSEGDGTTTSAAGTTTSSGGGISSFPVPVLVLGGVAILLVIAGAIGMLWQRRHPREDDAAGA